MKAALLVIDVQDSFKAGARWERRNNPAFEQNVERLIAAFRRADQPVVYFLHSDGDPHFERTSPHHRLMNFLTPLAGEPVMRKITRNCFTSTPLIPHLLREGAGRVVICGIQTEQCCETTARIGADFGFAVDFVTEATLTFPIARTDAADSEELSADAVVERTEYALRGRFARIVSVADIEQSLTIAATA